ncbi:MAG: class I SAM-dependent methyltransferase [Halobacteriota archaeon]|nr:class I SAM-dependent methyltransferase [Halobacteriota archaeon]
MDRKEEKGPDHKGGNIHFWTGSEVSEYDKNQVLFVEYKSDINRSIARIAKYHSEKNEILSPTILDIGCGPGTLSQELLEFIPGCEVTGVDSSEGMVHASLDKLRKYVPHGYKAVLSNFNEEDFFSAVIPQEFDLIVSSLALHYVSDERKSALFKEIHKHMKENGLFIACIGNLSKNPQTREMEEVFKAEYAYENAMKKSGNNLTIQSFESFFSGLRARQKDMNINWRSPEDYLIILKDAGFTQPEVVWHAWTKSIYIAEK